MSENLLTVKNLSVEYRTDLETVKAVNNISFTLNRGETLGLVGETGAGKTTTALALMRLLPEYTGRIPNGEIIFDEKNLVTASDAEMRMIRGGRIAMIFQDPMTSLNPVMSVGDQISEALEFHNELKRNKEEIGKRVDEVLNMVGIPPGRKYDYPHQFSGGMKQRVVIAMALACEPDLLIADEPTTALDVTIQAQVINMIRELRDRLGTAMIMITHDLGIVAQTCDNVAVMYAGELIEVGTAADIYKSGDHHPYTAGLFGSIPNLKTRSRRLTPIPGLMPDMSNLPPGCSFSPRCPNRNELCETTRSSIYRNGTHAVNCRLFDGRGRWIKEEKAQ
ncbi:MAG: ABC transporter ATP-binding protein [Defluviitaleaceae bacterium]|nr:ABC transporter ATP-binding protein [Defluviitaleaceae bacterium]MCL2836697.1 ABC transporter ATP-binding protein [Defluviitaleaceae bacterium]